MTTGQLFVPLFLSFFLSFVFVCLFGLCLKKNASAEQNKHKNKKKEEGVERETRVLINKAHQAQKLV
jgi:uncharacterized membrane protein